MPAPAELEAKFRKALKSDMTAQVENDRSPIWFFTARDTENRAETPDAEPRHRHLHIEGAQPVRDHAWQPVSRQ